MEVLIKSDNIAVVSYINIVQLFLLGYLFIRLRWFWVNTSYRLDLSVYALQCLTGKVDDNNI